MAGGLSVIAGGEQEANNKRKQYTTGFDESEAGDKKIGKIGAIERNRTQ